MDPSDETRHRCEVRQVLRWRVERGIEWVRAWLDGYVSSEGKRVRGVAEIRGEPAAKRLRDACREQWAAGNRGEPGDWRG